MALACSRALALSWMPGKRGSWDPQVYRERARAWQAQADKMEPGKTRDATLALAEGYAKLADLIEQDFADRKVGPLREVR